MHRAKQEDSKLIARLASEKTTSRFVLMEELERAKRSEPGPSDYQTKTIQRDFGIDGFTQKISNTPKLIPCHNYKQLSKNKLVLLQKDNSYLDVGPGQYEPTRGPASNSTKHAPPQIPILNPRSRASASKMFTNSQLLPSATKKLNSTILISDLQKNKEVQGKNYKTICFPRFLGTLHIVSTVLFTVYT